MGSLPVLSRSVGVVLLISLLFSAHSAVATNMMDPEDWPALSLPAFVVEVRGALAGESVPPATRAAAATQAAERLTGLAADAVVAYDDFLWLYHWAGEQLTAAQKTALAARRALPSQEIPNWTIAALRRVFAAQYGTDVPLEQRDTALTTWLAGKTEATAYQLSTPDAAWLVTKIRGLQNRRKAAAGISEASLAALRAYVGQLLAEEAISQAAYKDVIALFEWSQNQMSAASRAAARARIAAPLAAAGEIKTWKLTSCAWPITR